MTRTLGLAVLLIAFGCSGSTNFSCNVTCTDGSQHQLSVAGDGGDVCTEALATACPPLGTGTCNCQN